MKICGLKIINIVIDGILDLINVYNLFLKIFVFILLFIVLFCDFFFFFGDELSLVVMML